MYQIERETEREEKCKAVALVPNSVGNFSQIDDNFLHLTKMGIGPNHFCSFCSCPTRICNSFGVNTYRWPSSRTAAQEMNEHLKVPRIVSLDWKICLNRISGLKPHQAITNSLLEFHRSQVMMLCHVLSSHLQLSSTVSVVTQVQVEDQERLLKAHEHFVKSEAGHFAWKFVNVFPFW